MADISHPTAFSESRTLPHSLLAIDLSADLASVAVYVSAIADGGWHCEDMPGGAAGSANLLPGAQRVLAQAGIGIHELEAVAFGAGPGAFTGVRTAAAVAQGLAVARDLPVVPVGTLEALVFSVLTEFPEVQQVLAVTDARMGEVYFALYARNHSDGTTVQSVEPAVAAPEAAWERLSAELHASACIVGAVHLLPASAHQRIERALTARMVGAVALARWPKAVDAALAQPAYVRNKVAQTTVEREQAALARLEADSIAKAGA